MKIIHKHTPNLSQMILTVDNMISPKTILHKPKPKQEQPKPKQEQSKPNYAEGVSICISAYNAADYIEECLDGVAAQTWFKTHDNWEIILGIDACEKTLAKVKEIMDKYTNLRVFMMNENVGTYITCNTIMSLARYRWLQRFDSDDIMYDNMIETIMNKKGDSKYIIPYYQKASGELKKGTGVMCIDHDIFDLYGGFQPWRCCADSELYERMRGIADVLKIKQARFYRRILETSLTHAPETKVGSKHRNEKFKYIREHSHTIHTIKMETTKFSIIREIPVPNDWNVIKPLILKRAKQKGFKNFNIDNPKTWCEKIQWLQYHDNIELRALCADKIMVHEYCKEKLGKDICVPILKVYDSPDDINLDELPDKFVLKCNHGCAMNIICRDKSQLDVMECINKLRNWLENPFGVQAVQLHYPKIERKCFAETYIGEAPDYKFWCFNGKPEYCTVNSYIGMNSNTKYSINWYDMDWNFVKYSRTGHPCDPNNLNKKPECFELMKEYAGKLSADFPFVCVDFYEVDGVVYLGELTFTRNSGFIKWTDPKVDTILGDKIKLNYN